MRLQLSNDMNRLDRLDAESETDRIEGESSSTNRSNPSKR